MKKNITLDFTATTAVAAITEEQELALMPASLAKRLLKQYADHLVSASQRDIVERIADNLNAIASSNEKDKIDLAMIACAEFIQERTLIRECARENWHYFNTERETLRMESEQSAMEEQSPE